MSLHFDDAAVRRLLRLDALLAGMRRALIDLSAGRVVQPLRMVMEIPAHQGLLFVKPALTQDALVTKLITQLPGNAARGLPTMLATLVLRLEGLDVTVFGQKRAPYRNSDLLEQLGARYLSTTMTPVAQGAAEHGPFDIIFEATGFSPIVFDAMQALAKNGVLVLSSVTGGDRRVEVPSDKINLEFVLGNKVMVGTVNANREYFERGVEHMALAESEFGGWLEQLLTHPVHGLDNYQQLIETLTTAKDAIKVYCEVAATAPR